jgi:DNA-binding XRE family transcriptional regulator
LEHFCVILAAQEEEFTMVHSRIREIRKQKGLTLQEVAERSGTTAQTIGRLETGMRTLSLNWVNRIAKALGVESSMLLTLPEQGDIEILGEVGMMGSVLPINFGTVSLRFMGTKPMALKIKANMGEYRQGDKVICEGKLAQNVEKAVGHDCLIELEDGERCFAKLVSGSRKNIYTLFPIGNAGTLVKDCKVIFAAPVVTLVRTFEV